MPTGCRTARGCRTRTSWCRRSRCCGRTSGRTARCCGRRNGATASTPIGCRTVVRRRLWRSTCRKWTTPTRRGCGRTVRRCGCRRPTGVRCTYIPCRRPRPRPRCARRSPCPGPTPPWPSASPTCRKSPPRSRPFRRSSRAYPNRVAVDREATDNIGSSGGRAWFAVELEAGVHLQVRPGGQPHGRRHAVRPFLRGIYDEDGNHIPNTIENGTCYVVAGAWGSYRGTYTLLVEEVVDGI